MLWCFFQIPFTRLVKPSPSCHEYWLLMAHNFQRIALGLRVAALPGKIHSQWLTYMGGQKASTLPQSGIVLLCNSCSRAPHGIRLKSRLQLRQHLASLNTLPHPVFLIRFLLRGLLE